MPPGSAPSINLGPRRDLVLILTTRLLRAAAFGMAAVAIGLHLERLGLRPSQIGLILTVALLSAATTGVLAATLASRVGRRATLGIAGGLMALTGLDLAFSSSALLLVMAGITGMLGAANVDIGAYASIEQAALAESVEPRRRNLAFARYSLTGGLAAALGAILAGTASDLSGSRRLFAAYAVIGLITGLLPLLLSERAEAASPGKTLSRAQLRALTPLSALFFVDAFGGGLVANAVIAYWLHVRFGAGANVLGPAFAAIAILQSLSYEVSGRLANRIGLIRTMVFSHMPSNVLLALVPLSPSLPWAIAILFARFSVSQMDVPARQAFVVSIVPSAERAGAVAYTGLVRGVGQALGPLLSGAAIQSAMLGLPFFVAGGIKLIYDGSLYIAFRQRRGEHEVIG